MKNIDNILNKYFEGETSLEEEKLLQKYFQNENVDEKHKMYAPIFRYISQEKISKAILADQPAKKKRFVLWQYIAVCAAVVAGIILLTTPLISPHDNSFVVIDGIEYKNEDKIPMQALHSLRSIDNENDNEHDNVIESQIDLLDSFIDTE